MVRLPHRRCDRWGVVHALRSRIVTARGHHAAESQMGQIGHFEIAIGTTESEGRDGTNDQARLRGAHRPIEFGSTVDHACFPAVENNIGGAREALKRNPRRWMVYFQRRAALTQVVALEAEAVLVIRFAGRKGTDMPRMRAV